MIILASTDSLQVATSSIEPIDVHVSWLDNSSGAVSVGRKNTSITSAMTTTVGPSPSAEVQRNVRTLHIRNKGSADNVVTVIHFDGAVSVELYSETLAPDSQFQYNDGNGFNTAPL